MDFHLPLGCFGQKWCVPFCPTIPMIGRVDDSGRAIVKVAVAANGHDNPHSIEVWVDTGFTADLVIPSSKVEKLGLQQTGTVGGVLANGTQVLLATFHCEIQWFDRLLLFNHEPLLLRMPKAFSKSHPADATHGGHSTFATA